MSILLSALLTGSVVVNAGSVIAMLYIYRSFEKDLALLTRAYVNLDREFKIRHLGRSNGSGIQGMAEDTPVEQ